MRRTTISKLQETAARTAPMLHMDEMHARIEQENRELRNIVAELTLSNRLLRKKLERFKTELRLMEQKG